jgi:RNA polymerase sigma factor (TIGR02999 family)
MRRILVEAARRRGRLKRGGDLQRHSLRPDAIAASDDSDQLLAVHEALDKLESTNRTAAELVKLRYFAGFTIPEAANQLGISARRANQIWAYARAWLVSEIGEKPSA